MVNMFVDLGCGVNTSIPEGDGIQYCRNHKWPAPPPAVGASAGSTVHFFHLQLRGNITTTLVEKKERDKHKMTSKLPTMFWRKTTLTWRRRFQFVEMDHQSLRYPGWYKNGGAAWIIELETKKWSHFLNDHGTYIISSRHSYKHDSTIILHMTLGWGNEWLAGEDKILFNFLREDSVFGRKRNLPDGRLFSYWTKHFGKTQKKILKSGI